MKPQRLNFIVLTLARVGPLIFDALEQKLRLINNLDLFFSVETQLINVRRDDPHVVPPLHLKVFRYAPGRKPHPALQNTGLSTSRKMHMEFHRAKYSISQEKLVRTNAVRALQISG